MRAAAVARQAHGRVVTDVSLPPMLDDRPELEGILSAIRDDPDEETRWLSLARWLSDNGRDDEAVAVRVLWPTLRDNLASATLGDTLADMARNAKVLAAIARKVERKADATPPLEAAGWRRIPARSTQPVSSPGIGSL